MVRIVLYIQEGPGLNLNIEISYPEDFKTSLKSCDHLNCHNAQLPEQFSH